MSVQIELDKTRHLKFDLAAIRDELADPPTEAQRDRIAALLHGLHAIVALHFAKEEEIYLPLLDEHLTAGEATDVFARMERAEGSGGTPA